MKQKKITIVSIISLFLLFLTAGCASPRIPSPDCTVVFEDNPSLFFSNQIFEINPSEDLSVSVGVPHGERIASVNYEDYTVSAKTGESQSYDYYTLTLHGIRYSAVIRLSTAPAYSTTYHAGYGIGESITLWEDSPHLRFNTLPYQEQFTRNGYTPIGWNTRPDGSGIHIGFGSRIDHRAVQHLDLYAEWLPCTAADNFTFRISESEVSITGYHGTGDIIIPASIDGFPVTSIEKNAFGSINAERLVLPASLETVSPNAFGKISVRDFYFYDNIKSLPEEAFDSYQINRLHINAVLNPVYSGSYFDTLADKVDYLSDLSGQKKIVLFCGSSARFGYDSPLLEKAFPEYRVVNMGVYAYSNMLPQAKIILAYMGEGDILLSSPELDAIDKQFCGESALDKETFCMLESNYDMLALADCREFTDIFSAFSQYSESKRDMAPRSYLDSPSYYDEEGNRLNLFSYNRWGDYTLYRENNESGRSFGVKRACYNSSYIRKQDIDGLNAVFDSFAQKGVQVFFTYSPRNKISISEDSTPESILLLDERLRQELHAPVISSIQDSLMDPYYFYATDNHLSTEGVKLHTEQIIADLRTALEESP